MKVGTGRGRPTKLDRLRFTSPRQMLIEKIAELYGGKVEPWQPPKGSQQWQVITNATEVPVIIPPQDPSDSQWYEMWSAGGCQRRCDGAKDMVSKKACLCLASGCVPEKRDCKLHTRLRVMLEDVPGLGAWRIDTGSYYAAVELPGIAELLAMAQGAIPGKLVLDQRTVTRMVDGKPQTFNFAVPTLHVDEITPRQLMAGGVQAVINAARAAAVDAAAPQTAISSTADFPSLISAARTLEALRDLHSLAKQAGKLDDALKATFAAKADALKAAAAAPASPQPAEDDESVVDAEPVYEGELLPEGEWPETALVGGGQR
jgi:hypothetical protein